MIVTLQGHADRLGPPQATDGPEHPRRVLANNVGYFTTHRRHMDYLAYRRKGWPIGSGVTESTVKLFNKRVKGTQQFWNIPGVESILSLRALRATKIMTKTTWLMCMSFLTSYRRGRRMHTTNTLHSAALAFCQYEQCRADEE